MRHDFTFTIMEIIKNTDNTTIWKLIKKLEPSIIACKMMQPL